MASVTAASPLALGGVAPALTCEALELAVAGGAPSVVLDPAARARIEDSRAVFVELRDAGIPIYGTSTGFGPLVRHGAGDAGGPDHGAGLVAHLGAGWGPPAAPDVVRATMVLRLASLAAGRSGVRLEVVDALRALLAAGIVPWVPETGSVGASGDLVPLAHIARVLCGDGEIRTEDATAAPAAPALAERGLEPIALEGRDALALVNGTAFHTAYAALACARAERLLARAEELTGWIYRQLGCRRDALHPLLHEARGHPGQLASAAAIRRAAGGPGADGEAGRPLQEIYSLRCAPQVLGACRDQVGHARATIETELRGVSDNPVFQREDGRPRVLHGGNFHGQQVAFAADALNAALTQVAVLAERQLAALLDPAVTGGAPPLLAARPGASSGLAGAQLTATALLARVRAANVSHATSSIPTNGGNQDVVPMAAHAAQAAHGQTQLVGAVLAVTALAVGQLGFLREAGYAAGRAAAPPGWMPAVRGVDADRPLRADIDRVARSVLARP